MRNACLSHVNMLLLLRPGTTDKTLLQKNAQGWLQRALPRQHCCVGNSGHRASTGFCLATWSNWVGFEISPDVGSSWCFHYGVLLLTYLFNRSTGCGGGSGAIWPFHVVHSSPAESCQVFRGGDEALGVFCFGVLTTKKEWHRWHAAPRNYSVYVISSVFGQRRESGVHVAHGSSAWC